MRLDDRYWPEAAIEVWGGIEMRADLQQFRAIPMTVCGLWALALAMPAASETVSLNGIEMYYDTAGQGRPLVLLHGFMQVGAEWNPIKDELASEWQLVIPDLRGHGASTNPAGEFTMRQAALDVLALLDHLELDRVQAIGFSAGAETLLHMATQQPDRIEAMVLIGGAHYFSRPAREVMASFDADNIPEEEMQELRSVHRYGDQQIRALFDQMSGFKDSYEDMNFTAPYLSRITARTLIMQGDRDRFVPVSVGIELYDAIPNSYLWIVPNMDHLAMWGPIQDHFVCTATAFLKGEWQSRPARLCE